MTPTTILDSPTALAELVVDVVDGNGLEVAGEVVTVHAGHTIHGVTDSRGRVRFGQIPETVIRIATAGEVTDPIVLGGDTRVVIET